MQQVRKRTEYLGPTEHTEYETLRAGLGFTLTHGNRVLFTGVGDGAEAGECALKTAAAFSEIGKRVIYVEADFRTPGAISDFQAEEKLYGLTHYLAGLKPVRDCILKTETEGLHILFSGVLPPNPAELLSTEKFRSLLKVLGSLYDYVFVSAPSDGRFIDAALAGSVCDGTVTVVKAGEADGPGLDRVLRELELSKCTPIGVVLRK